MTIGETQTMLNETETMNVLSISPNTVPKLVCILMNEGDGHHHVVLFGILDRAPSIHHPSLHVQIKCRNQSQMVDCDDNASSDSVPSHPEFDSNVRSGSLLHRYDNGRAIIDILHGEQPLTLRFP